MATKSNNSKRIAKNTVVLYARMIVIMLITLYTSRVILHALGASDYGLYNVVGGVVLMLGFLKTSLTSATQRFLSYEMGNPDSDKERLRNVFSLSLTTHFFVALLIVILAETVGLWFLNTHIQIPSGRETAANWIYQFSVISIALSMVTVPYHACVISHEKMSFFALVTIIDAVLKLAISYTIVITPNDRLVTYGFLMMLTNVLNLFLYWMFDKKHFSESNYRWFWDTVLFKYIFSFSGWTIFGQLAVVGSTQGKSILVNIFHSVVANAAMGVAHQVNMAIVSLTSNFQTAFQPQLTKSYAAKDYDYFNKLLFGTSKISFFLLFIVSLPIMLNIDWVLSVWLIEVPQYAGTFCVFYIIASILNALATPLWIGIFATGNIKNYQLAVVFAYFTELFVIYLFFCAGFPPTTAFIIKVILNAIMVFIRLFFAHRRIECFSAWAYIKKVLSPVIVSTLITMGIAFVLISFSHGIVMRLVLSFVVFLLSIIVAYFVGMSNSERLMVKSLINKKIKK